MVLWFPTAFPRQERSSFAEVTVVKDLAMAVVAGTILSAPGRNRRSVVAAKFCRCLQGFVEIVGDPIFASPNNWDFP